MKHLILLVAFSLTFSMVCHAQERANRAQEIDALGGVIQGLDTTRARLKALENRGAPVEWTLVYKEHVPTVGNVRVYINTSTLTWESTNIARAWEMFISSTNDTAYYYLEFNLRDRSEKTLTVFHKKGTDFSIPLIQGPHISFLANKIITLLMHGNF